MEIDDCNRVFMKDWEDGLIVYREEEGVTTQDVCSNLVRYMCYGMRGGPPTYDLCPYLYCCQVVGEGPWMDNNRLFNPAQLARCVANGFKPTKDIIMYNHDKGQLELKMKAKPSDCEDC